MKNNTISGQSAAKLLSFSKYGERSTTIPVMGSTGRLKDLLGNGGNYYIYILRDPISNNIRYVGKSIDPPKRYCKHISDSKRFVDKTAKSNWIRKLLKNNLRPVLQVLFNYENENECDNNEIRFIRKLKKKGIILYNSTPGGDGGIIYKTCKPILRYDMEGNFIEEFSSISEACRKFKLKHSLLSATLNGKHDYLNNSVWKFKTEKNIKLKITRVLKRSEKLVNQYDLQGNFIKQWRSGVEACRFYNVHITSVRNCCLGKSKTSCGFIWKYSN